MLLAGPPQRGEGRIGGGLDVEGAGQGAPGPGRIAGPHREQAGAHAQRVLVGRIADEEGDLGQQVGGDDEVGRGAALLHQAGLGVQGRQVLGPGDERGVEARQGLVEVAGADVEVGAAAQQGGPLDVVLLAGGGGVELGGGAARGREVAARGDAGLAAARLVVARIPGQDLGVAGVGGVEVTGRLGGAGGPVAQAVAEGEVAGFLGRGDRERGGHAGAHEVGAAAEAGGAGEPELGVEVARAGLCGGLEVLHAERRRVGQLGQQQRGGLTVAEAALVGQRAASGDPQLGAVAVGGAVLEQRGPAAAEARPLGERAAQLAGGLLGLAGVGPDPGGIGGPHQGGAVDEQGAGPLAARQIEVTREVAEQRVGAPERGGQALAGVQRREVFGPGLKDQVDLVERLRQLAEREQAVDDLEVQRQALRRIDGALQAAAQQVDDADVVAAVAEDPLEQRERRRVVGDLLERLLQAGLGVARVAHLQRQLGAAEQQLGAPQRADGQLDLLLGDLQQLAGAAGLGEQAGQLLQRRQVLRELLEQGDEALDRGRRIALALVQAGEDRQQEHAARAADAALQLAVVELAQAVEAAELEEHALEAVERGAVGLRRGDGLFVELAGALELLEVLLEHLAGAQLGLGPLLGAEAGGVGGGDLELQQLEQLVPRLVGDEVAAGVLERRGVAGEQLERPAHGAEALADAVEADHRQLAEAVEQLGLGAGVGAADGLELAGAGLDGDVVAGRRHGQLLEVAPQAEVVGLQLGGRVQQRDGAGSLADLAQHQAGAGQRAGALLGRTRVGLGLERAQHQLGVAGGLGDAEQVLNEEEVAGLLLAGGDEQGRGEVEVAALAGLEHGEVARDGGDGPRVVQNLELRLEVGDQRHEVALHEGDGLDRAQHREVLRGRAQGRLITLQSGGAILEVGLDQLASLAVERRRLARVASGADLEIEVANGVADVAAPEKDPVEEAHRRPQVRHQLQGVGQQALGLAVLAAHDTPTRTRDGDHSPELRLTRRCPRQHLQHLEQGHLGGFGHRSGAVYTGARGRNT
ncbi:hypothetical protein [Nannocystis pusilla]|uniref:hypothetical protein n=1 Tax=Nannocystis pusilla TaxID=889268 RepID=UPI003B7EC6EB